jgi:hypothetical protein
MSTTGSSITERERSALFGDMIERMADVDTNTVPSPQGAENMADCESDDEEWDSDVDWEPVNEPNNEKFSRTAPLPLRALLKEGCLVASRDVDSICLFSNSIVDIITAMEKNAVVKISRAVSNRPSTSSRHSVATRVKVKSGKLVKKDKSLHQFQNINIGTVTANNIRFHLNIFDLEEDQPLKYFTDYRPFTHIKRLVIVAAMNRTVTTKSPVERRMSCG